MKPKISLLPPQGILLAAECMTLNEAKYPDPVWETMTVYQHVDASLRHLFEFLKGEVDPETGMSHLVHACCRILMAVSREVDAERDHQQTADERLEVLDTGTPWWTPQDQDEKWIDEFDSKHFSPAKGVPIGEIPPADWDRLAQRTKPTWTHHTPSGDMMRRTLDDMTGQEWNTASQAHYSRKAYERALREQNKDSE